MTITRSQYLQLTGLLVLAKRHHDSLKDIEKALYAITQERNHDGTLMNPQQDMGHTSDALWSDYSADELMGKLDLAVEKEETT